MKKLISILAPIIYAGLSLPFTRKPFLGKRRANFIIALFNAVTRMEIKRGQSDQVIIGNDKIVLQLKESAAPGTTASGAGQRFRIQSITTDHLVCRTWDGTTLGSTNINVAKPTNVRQSITNEIILGLNWAVTYTGNAARTLTNVATSRVIRQALVPTYEVNGTVQNGQIWAMEMTGGTGVVGAPSWLELSPSRRWETTYIEFDVCQNVGGVATPKKAIVQSSDLYNP
ncbi:MAG: hypothetical protein V4787_05455 [Pseudomonadota bacterium]